MNPVQYSFDKFLQSIWMDNTPEEAYALWRSITSNSSQYATENLAILDNVLSDPPSDLVERMQQHGWIFLTHDDPEESSFTFDEYLDWLRKMVGMLRQSQTSQ
jgi:hypothetical protein